MAPVTDVPAKYREAVARLLALNAELVARADQLQTALESRVLIEQAKGVLAARHGIDIHTAFEVLRRAARSNRVKIRDLAARVVAEPETPAEITRHI